MHILIGEILNELVLNLKNSNPQTKNALFFADWFLIMVQRVCAQLVLGLLGIGYWVGVPNANALVLGGHTQCIGWAQKIQYPKPATQCYISVKRTSPRNPRAASRPPPCRQARRSPQGRRRAFQRRGGGRGRGGVRALRLLCSLAKPFGRTLAA